MREIVVILHNIRSTYNVGAIFRSSDGFGVSRLILSGYTPYPRLLSDQRLPHISEKLTGQIHKVALGSESSVPFDYMPYPNLGELRREGFTIIGLEQDQRAVKLQDFDIPDKVALILGEEVEGIASSLKNECETLIEIPMLGMKESFNVSVAAGIALYALSTKA